MRCAAFKRRPLPGSPQDVRGDVFFFLQKCLESEAGGEPEESPSCLSACQVDVVPARLDPADPTLAAFGGGEDLTAKARETIHKSMLFGLRIVARRTG